MWMVIVHLGERQTFRSIVQDYSTMLISNSFVINDSPRFLDSYTFKKSTILYLPPSLSSFFHSSLRVIPSSIFFCERFTTQWKPSCNLTSESRAMVTFDRVSLSRFCPGGNKIMADLGTCMYQTCQIFLKYQIINIAQSINHHIVEASFLRNVRNPHVPNYKIPSYKRHPHQGDFRTPSPQYRMLLHWLHHHIW